MEDAAFFPITNPKQANYHATQVHNAIYVPAMQNFDPANVWLDPASRAADLHAPAWRVTPTSGDTPCHVAAVSEPTATRPGREAHALLEVETCTSPSTPRTESSAPSAACPSTLDAGQTLGDRR